MKRFQNEGKERGRTTGFLATAIFSTVMATQAFAQDFQMPSPGSEAWKTMSQFYKMYGPQSVQYLTSGGKIPPFEQIKEWPPKQPQSQSQPQVPQKWCHDPKHWKYSKYSQLSAGLGAEAVSIQGNVTTFPFVKTEKFPWLKKDYKKPSGGVSVGVLGFNIGTGGYGVGGAFAPGVGVSGSKTWSWDGKTMTECVGPAVGIKVHELGGHVSHEKCTPHTLCPDYVKFQEGNLNKPQAPQGNLQDAYNGNPVNNGVGTPEAHITFDENATKASSAPVKPVQLQSLPKHRPGTQSSTASIRY